METTPSHLKAVNHSWTGKGYWLMMAMNEHNEETRHHDGEDDYNENEHGYGDNNE